MEIPLPQNIKEDKLLCHRVASVHSEKEHIHIEVKLYIDPIRGPTLIQVHIKIKE